MIAIVLLGNLNFKLPANLYFVFPRRPIYHFYEALRAHTEGEKKLSIMCLHTKCVEGGPPSPSFILCCPPRGAISTVNDVL